MGIFSYIVPKAVDDVKASIQEYSAEATSLVAKNRVSANSLNSGFDFIGTTPADIVYYSMMAVGTLIVAAGSTYVLREYYSLC